jgi:hypothetical protein
MLYCKCPGVDRYTVVTLVDTYVKRSQLHSYLPLLRSIWPVLMALNIFQ